MVPIQLGTYSSLLLHMQLNAMFIISISKFPHSTLQLAKASTQQWLQIVVRLEWQRSWWVWRSWGFEVDTEVGLGNRRAIVEGVEEDGLRLDVVRLYGLTTPTWTPLTILSIRHHLHLRPFENKYPKYSLKLSPFLPNLSYSSTTFCFPQPSNDLFLPITM